MSKIKKPYDSLLTENTEDDKESESKLDLISRQDAIHILACEMYAEAQRQSEGYDVGFIEDYIPEATAWMNDAPSADRPKGEWVDNTNGTYTCDQCGCKHSRSNFCPNCGARMKGGDDE